MVQAVVYDFKILHIDLHFCKGIRPKALLKSSVVLYHSAARQLFKLGRSYE